MKEPFVNKRSLEIDIICLRNRWNSTLSATDATVVKTFYPNIWNNNLLTKVVLQLIICVMEVSEQHFLDHAFLSISHTCYQNMLNNTLDTSVVGNSNLCFIKTVGTTIR